MQKQRIILIIGVILSLISLVIVKVYIDQKTRAADEEAKKRVESFTANFQENQASVLVAKEDIPKGATIEAENLNIAIVPKEYVQPQAVYSLDRIAGMVTVVPISAGEQITLNKLSQPRQAGGLAEITPVGKRAVTITVDNVSNLVGLLKPGDYVDVISLMPIPVQTPEGQQTNAAVIPLFQNILILAVGRDIGGPLVKATSRYKQEEQPQEPSPLITLALSPQEANLIAFVQEQGKIRLILRSPADSQIQLTQPTSWDTLFQYLIPTAASPASSYRTQQEEVVPVEQPSQVRPQDEGDVVEIYRGLNKDRVILSK